MQDLEILAVAKTYTKETVIGMGALKGAPCTVQGVVDAGDGTQTLTLKWTDDNGVAHTTDISLPSAIFEITSPSNGQTLRYNSTSGKFENSNVSFSADLEDLDNVVITSVQNGQVLTYDAANNRWINADGSTVGDLSDLEDVVISTVQNGQYLVYDGTNHKWVNATLEINASDVGYDNTTSGLSATDAQGAIDEIALSVSQLSASKVGYDGTTSGLSADKVQGAIDELADEKVDKETGKGLSANDFTDTLKNKLDGIEENAEENDIDTIKVNGTALTPQNKAVDILLNMTKLSDVDLTGLTDGMIIIYDAANNKWYAGANTGATYTAGEGIEIDQNNKISSKIVLFTGTEAQWNALPLADKIKFTHYATNDDQTGQIDPVPTQNSANLMTSGGIWSAIQDFISKVTGATANNFAALDANGNVIDSGNKASDFAAAQGLADEAKTRGAMGAKNLIPMEQVKDSTVNSHGTWSGNVYTDNGVEFTFNPENGTVVANGTSNGGEGTHATFYYAVRSNDSRLNMPANTYKLTGCPAGGSSSTYFLYLNTKYQSDNTNNGGMTDAGEGVTATYANDMWAGVYVDIANGTTVANLEFKPMLRLASDIDDTYQPYAKTNKELTEDSVDWDDLSEVGAVNLLENKASDYVSSASGLTFTVNDDKSVTVSATSGTYPFTVLANTSVTINSDACNHLKDGNSYRLSGCPSGGRGSTYYLAFYQSGVVDKSDKGDGYVFTKTASMTSVLINISIKQNAVFESALTFYPMITPVDYNGPYVPYAMTNRELTNGGYSILSATANTDIIDLNNLTFIKSVKVVNATGYFHTQVAAAKNDLLYTFDEKIKTGDVRYKPYVLAANNSGSTFLLRVDENGIYIDNNDGIPVGNYAIIGGIFVQ